MRLNKDEQRHYKREQATAKLVRTCYEQRCKGDSLTPEKLFALCRLTWFTKNWLIGKLPALWNLWDKGNNPPDLDKPDELKSYGFPPEVVQCAIEDTGVVNFYHPYRKSSLDWVRQNFYSLAPLVRQVAILTGDDKTIEIAGLIENFPKIPHPTRNAGMSPSSLLTPLFAYLDPRQRFPVVNKADHVVKLHRKLGITSAALPDKFETLIRLIGQYGIRDALMLDVVSDRLVKMNLAYPNSQSSHPPANGGKPLARRDVDGINIILRARSIIAKQLHNKMTNRLKELCRHAQLELSEGNKRSFQYDALITDYDGHGKDILIEAKSSLNRPELRLAVGQLFDYRRGLKRRAATDLAVLLPGKPDHDSDAFLADVGVYVLWFTDQQFTSIDGKLKLKP